MQGAGVASGDILLNLGWLSHSRDYCADDRIRQNETQSHLGKRHGVRQNVLQCVHAIHRLVEVLRIEISISPIARRKLRVACHLAAQTSLIEGYARNNTDIAFLANWKELIFGRLVENVVDDLNHIHQTGANRRNTVGWLPTVQAQAKKSNCAVPLEFFDGFSKFPFISPAVVPNVKLQDIDGIRS